MLTIQISDPAKADLWSIKSYTIEQYDEDQSERYFALIDAAFDDIALEPESVVARRLPDLGEHIWMRSLAASKRRGMTNVQTPRHVILYSLKVEGVANILRVLHDSMDIDSHLEPYSE